MSRSSNSRRGSRDRHVREYLRHEVEHEPTAAPTGIVEVLCELLERMRGRR